ncbi:group III truncated hemoglobin [soil metagenome]
MSSNSDLKFIAEGHDRRAKITEEIAGRTGIDDVMVENLVRAFYGRIAQDAVLGPIFEERVGDWDTHIAKLCDFWSSAALMTGRYHGSPMTAHSPLPIGRAEFARWLAIFAETANSVCPPVAAAHFIERANRIANSLEAGIAASRKPRNR